MAASTLLSIPNLKPQLCHDWFRHFRSNLEFHLKLCSSKGVRLDEIKWDLESQNFSLFSFLICKITSVQVMALSPLGLSPNILKNQSWAQTS